jgi:hypothetical protein
MSKSFAGEGARITVKSFAGEGARATVKSFAGEGARATRGSSYARRRIRVS